MTGPGGPAPAWSVVRAGDGPIVAVALHQGHDLRPEVAALARLDHAERRREEDPYTATWTRVGDVRVIVHRSRFEVDLNRPPDEAVYRRPEDAWGLDLWIRPPDDRLVAASRAIHAEFYAALGDLLADIAARHGGFVVYDIHSYNHRREGPDAPAADEAENPVVNLGTGNLDRGRWAGVIDAFLTSIRAASPDLDVRENVRFRGGYLAKWVAERFGARGCALAIECKKTFMDEWSDRPDPERIRALGDALGATVAPVRDALETALGRAA